MTIEIVKYLLGGTLPILGVLALVFLYPDKVEQWSVLLWKLVYFVFKRGEKKIIAHDIQGRVNEFSRSLEKEMSNYEPVGVQIKWIKTDEKPINFFEENKLVIRMRHHDDQNKNFINAAMIFISKSILPRAKKYLSSSQKESLDLFVGKKLCEKEKPKIADKFFEEYFGHKTLSNEKVMDLLEKYEVIDKVGIFYSVLVQELNFLGGKVFFKRKNSEIVEEVNRFVDFLKIHADRRIGDNTVQNYFEGRYCRCGIVIVAKFFKRQTGDITPYMDHIEKLVTKKIENIYLLGPAEADNKHFVERISLEVMSRFGYMEYFSREYKSKIKKGGERVEVDSFLILLRSPNIIRTYDEEYQKKFFTKTQPVIVRRY